MHNLVSIVICTYNSAETILETLNSISEQTWTSLEIVIADDCSTDNTLELCQKWLNESNLRFVNSKLISSEINTGVSANANRGIKSSNGDWIKLLGGDDTLKPNCVEDNMSWIAFHPQTKVLFSRVEVYRDNFKPNNLLITTPGIPYDPKGIMAADRSAESQYKMLLVSDRIHYSPSVFLHRETLLSVKGFDERFKLLDDYPLWLNLTREGHKLYFMDKVTVNYRRHSKAINNTGLPYLINPNYFRSEQFRRVYTYAFLPANIRFYQRYNWFALQIFRFNWFNKNKKPNRLLLALITSYLNPFKYFIWISKRFNKSLSNNEFYI